MNIISIPRSGATQFGMDYANQNGLTWRGEKRLEMVDGYGYYARMKQGGHTSGKECQPIYPTINSYWEAMKDPSSLWLINSHDDVSGHLYDAGVCSTILRKNYMHSFHSMHRLFNEYRKVHNLSPNLPSVPWWVDDWKPFVQNLSCIISWVTEYDVPVVWYEEYFPDADIERYNHPDNWQLSRISDGSGNLAHWLNRFNIENKMKELVNRG